MFDGGDDMSAPVLLFGAIVIVLQVLCLFINQTFHHSKHLFLFFNMFAKYNEITMCGSSSVG